MQREFMLHVRKATKVLPVRILQPTLQQRRIGLVEGMFEIMQTDQQAYRFGWRAIIRAIAFRQRDIKTVPIDPICQQYQWVIRVEQLIKMRLEKLKLTVWRGGRWFHGTKLQGFEGPANKCLQILTPNNQTANRELQN